LTTSGNFAANMGARVVGAIVFFGILFGSVGFLYALRAPVDNILINGGICVTAIILSLVASAVVRTRIKTSMDGPIKACQFCGGEAEFIERNQRYQCQACNRFLTGGANCDRCGQAARWVKEYRKFYCDNCKHYPKVDVMEVSPGVFAGVTKTPLTPPPAAPPPPPPPTTQCPRCRGAARLVPEYAKHFCDACKQYV